VLPEELFRAIQSPRQLFLLGFAVRPDSVHRTITRSDHHALRATADALPAGTSFVGDTSWLRLYI
jgi:hypothetical protein